jgi:hypothetical protein
MINEARLEIIAKGEVSLSERSMERSPNGRRARQFFGDIKTRAYGIPQDAICAFAATSSTPELRPADAT